MVAMFFYGLIIYARKTFANRMLMNDLFIAMDLFLLEHAKKRVLAKAINFHIDEVVCILNHRKPFLNNTEQTYSCKTYQTIWKHSFYNRNFLKIEKCADSTELDESR
jgi:hypothetical protein